LPLPPRSKVHVGRDTHRSRRPDPR
jgi:hypothetical protein